MPNRTNPGLPLPKYPQALDEAGPFRNPGLDEVLTFTPRAHLGVVRVPESAAELVLLLGARGQKALTDQAWYDDAKVVPLPP